MKTLYQVLVLLAVMLVISGGFYLGFKDVQGGGREGGEAFEGGERPAPPEGFEREEGEFGEREEGGSLGWFSFLAIAPELLKVSLVALVVYWLKKGYDALMLRRTPKASPPAVG